VCSLCTGTPVQYERTVRGRVAAALPSAIMSAPDAVLVSTMAASSVWWRELDLKAKFESGSSYFSFTR